jgi:hypothetical protein
LDEKSENSNETPEITVKEACETKPEVIEVISGPSVSESDICSLEELIKEPIVVKTDPEGKKKRSKKYIEKGKTQTTLYGTKLKPEVVDESLIESPKIVGPKEIAPAHILIGMGYVMLHFLKTDAGYKAKKGVTEASKSVLKEFVQRLPLDYSKYLRHCKIDLEFLKVPSITYIAKALTLARKGKDTNDTALDCFRTKICVVPREKKQK